MESSASFAAPTIGFTAAFCELHGDGIRRAVSPGAELSHMHALKEPQQLHAPHQSTQSQGGGSRLRDEEEQRAAAAACFVCEERRDLFTGEGEG
jgi:hypothetical protein